MSLIPQDIIDQILQETNIIDIIEEYVPLKKTGANFKACCPFHNEKTASFVASPQKQIYHCFGCHAGGNVLGFLMNYEKIDFPTAIKKLADRLHIKIDTQTTPSKENLKDKYYKINSYALWFFKQEYQKFKKAKDYVKSRYLKDELVDEFELGYAPDQFETLLKFLQSKHVPLKSVEQLGLIKKRESANYYDFFRDRLIFPIHNLKGSIVGFGGRTLSNQSQAKYINSAESPIYNKSRELYGFYQAKREISQKDQAILVEGYIDVIACFQAGLKNCVAPLGTSLTSDQIKALKRYTKNMILMFDGDNAGKKAALKAVDTCLQQQIHPKVALLPEGKDPGDYLSSNSSDLIMIVDKAPTALNWIFSEYIGRITSEPSQRAQTVRQLNRWIKRLSDPIEQMEYAKKLAQFFEISPQEIEKLLEITNDSGILPPLEAENLNLEKSLLYLHLQDSSRFDGLTLEELSLHFKDKELRRLAKELQFFTRKHETFDEALAIQAMPKELQSLLSHICLKGSELTQMNDIESYLKIFWQQRNKKRLKDLTAKILQAETLQNDELKQRLLKEKQKLIMATKP